MIIFKNSIRLFKYHSPKVLYLLLICIKIYIIYKIKNNVVLLLSLIRLLKNYLILYLRHETINIIIPQTII